MNSLDKVIREVSEGLIDFVSLVNHTYDCLFKDFNNLKFSYASLDNSFFGGLDNDFFNLRNFSNDLGVLVSNLENNLSSFYYKKKGGLFFDDLNSILSGNYRNNGKKVWKWEDRVGVALDYVINNGGLDKDYKIINYVLDNSSYLVTKRKDFLRNQKMRVEYFLTD